MAEMPGTDNRGVMMKGILAWLAIFLFSLYWFFMFNENTMIFLLILEIIYLVGAVLSVSIARSSISVSMNNLITTAEKNQKVPIKIIIKNKQKILPIHCRIYLNIRNTLTGEGAKYRTMVTVQRKSERTLTVPIAATKCGNMLVTLEKIRIYDFMMIMSSAKKLKDSTQIRILPELHLMPVQVTRKTRDFIADADEYSGSESGDDPSEIYQIREYTDKDSIHDIHWKLSAKSDELLVKERGKALGSTVLVWINTLEKGVNNKKHKYKGFNFKRKKNNREKSISPDVLEIAASFSLSMYEQECIHTVAWFEPETGKIKKKRVSKEVHIYELLNRIALIEPCADEEKLNVMYRDSFKGESFSTIVEIKTDGEILVNGDKTEIPMEKGNIAWEQFGITV